MERREDCYCLNVFPQNSYIEILTWKIMLLGGKAFGRFLSHEVEPSWIRLVPYRRGSREISTSFYCVRLQWKVFQLRVFTQPCLGHDLELPVSRTLENVFIAYKLPNLWYFFFFFNKGEMMCWVSNRLNLRGLWDTYGENFNHHLELRAKEAIQDPAT